MMTLISDMDMLLKKKKKKAGVLRENYMLIYLHPEQKEKKKMR